MELGEDGLTEDNKKHRTLWVLCLCQVGTMLGWSNLSAIIPILRTEWSISNDQVGTLLSTFQLGYVLAVIFTGWLTDKFGGRLVFAFSAFETGLAGLGFIFFAHDYQSALLWRTLAGLGQGGLYIPGIKILSSWYPGPDRGRIIGIYTCSTVFAYAGAYFLASTLAVAYSWQTGLLWTTIWAFPSAVVVFFLVIEKKTFSDTAPLVKGESKAVFTLAGKAFWLIIAGYIGHMWELYAFWGWLGAYMTYVFTLHGYETSVALGYGGAIAAACTAMGGISPGLGGWVSDRYGRCLSATALMFISGCCALLFGWLAEYSLYLVIIIGLIYGFFIVADSAIYKAGLTELVPAHTMGSALGLQSVLGFGITVITPRLFGLIVDHYSWGWAFSFLAIGPFLGGICMVLLRNHPGAWQLANGKR
jgi:MFS family permease